MTDEIKSKLTIPEACVECKKEGMEAANCEFIALVPEESVKLIRCYKRYKLEKYDTLFKSGGSYSSGWRAQTRKPSKNASIPGKKI